MKKNKYIKPALMVGSIGLITLGMYNLAKAVNVQNTVIKDIIPENDENGEGTIIDYNDPKWQAPADYYLSPEAMLKPSIWEVATSPFKIFQKVWTVEDALNDKSYTTTEVALNVLKQYTGIGVIEKTAEVAIEGGTATAEMIESAFNSIAEHFKKWGILYIVGGVAGVVIAVKVIK